MRIISFIDADEIIENILRHLDLWETRCHDPPAQEDVEKLGVTRLDDFDFNPTGSELAGPKTTALFTAANE